MADLPPPHPPVVAQKTRVPIVPQPRPPAVYVPAPRAVHGLKPVEEPADGNGFVSPSRGIDEQAI